MTTREVLIAAKAKIDRPEKRTIGCLARCANGIPCNPCDSFAIAWSMIGAVEAVADSWREFDGPRDALYQVVGELPVSHWEAAPTRTHAEVMAAFDRAIEAFNG